MRKLPIQSDPTQATLQIMRTYVADLELEVDRLRKRGQFVEHEVRTSLKRIHNLSKETSQPLQSLESIGSTSHELATMLAEIQDPPGYHPAHDQVIGIPLRSLLEHIFRWHQRVETAQEVALRLELAAEQIDWFPARLRHILDNLLSNSLKYRDPAKSDQWVEVELTVTPDLYEFRVADNGLGLSSGAKDQLSELFFRAAPARAAGLGVGLAVVRLLVDGSEGTLSVSSGEGQGSTFLLALPRYDLDDFLT